MYSKKRLSLAVSAALGLTTLVTAGSALAQDQQDAEESDGLLEEVIVTGSRIISEDGFGRTSPVTVMGMEDIDSFGLTRVEDFLNQLPQIEAGQTSFISNGSTGTANIDLRGLGPNRTLVLLNGRRLQPGGLYSNAPDINQIPASMIERVEVLTGGASATYGADAVAGVVNFIMRKVDGVELSVGMSGYQHDNDNDYIQSLMDLRNFEYPTGDSGLDGKAYNFDLTMGSEFAGGRGNASAYITYRTNEELRQGSRDYSSCALNDAGTACGGSSNAVVPNFFIYGENPDGSINFDAIGVTDWWTLQSDSSLQPYDGTNVYNFAPINHFMRPDDRWSGGAFLDFEINEHAIAFMEIPSGHHWKRTTRDLTDSQSTSANVMSKVVRVPISSSTAHSVS
jgi:outer membrane receptor protein involved in Fe transport